MKYFISGILLIIFALAPVVAQEEEDKPIRPPFETVTLIDNHTTVNPYQGSFTIEIQHRFSEIKSVSDLFGIYGTANTRLALSYGITDRIMVGFGTTKGNKLQDLEWKVNILTQTRSGKIPVSLSYMGNTVLNAGDKSNFGPEADYKFIHRLSYLHQLIVSRKFGQKFSFQLAPTFTYFNAIEDGYNNGNFSLYAGGRLQVLGMNSIIFEYDQPFFVPDNVTVYPNMALGVEIGTSTHAFRVFASNYNYLVKNYNVVYNTNNPLDGKFQFGFNISIRF